MISSTKNYSKKIVLFFLLLIHFSFAVQSQTYTFTPCGATGRFGPTQVQSAASYSNTSLNGLVTTSAGIQSFTVPATGVYRIESYGAKGGSGQTTVGGFGAKMRGDFSFVVGQVLKIAVGQIGGTGLSAGGGGASFVTDNSNTPLCIAGGGGGGANINLYYSNSAQAAGSTSTSGMGGANGNASVVASSGGTSGGGGSAPTTFSIGQGSGGGGYSGNGANGNPSQGGLAFVNGGTGGAGASSTVGVGGDGGFGGGGGGDWSQNTGSGGAGGYSGGGGGTYYGCGGGGGSYNSGSNQSNTSGFNSGQGYIVFTRISGINISQTAPVLCNGQLSAALSATAYGGIAPYTYTWSPSGSNSSSISGLGAGIYTCSARDASLTLFTSTFAITQPSLLVTTVSSQSNVSCNGGVNGMASITASGGTAPYTYTWFPSGGNGATATNLASGVYTCAIKDANNCISSNTVSITQPVPLSIFGFATNASVCSGGTSALVGAGALTYTWSGGVSNGVSFTPSVTTIYTVTGTDASGCVATATTIITVNPTPTLSISGSSSVCAGYTISLSASGASSYTWSTLANASTIIVSPSVTTNYSLTGSNGSCQSYAVKTVSVINAPVLLANASNSSVCLGNTTTLFGSGASSYAWSGGVINNTAFTPTITNSYTVTGTSSCGTATAVITITVNSLPNVLANASNSIVCFGTNVTLSGTGANSYIWSGGVINNVAFTPASSANYTVIGTDVNGCQNSTVKTIIVNPLPNVTASASNSVICIGQSVLLFGGGAVSYSWTSGVMNSTAFSPSITASYTVTGTDANGCQNFASQTVSVSNLPVVTANATNTSVCLGNSTILYGSGAVTYTWSGGAINNAPITPTANVTYTVTGTGACGNANAVITITVNNLPTVTANASTTLICATSSVTLFGGGAQSYLWSGGATNNVAFSPTATSVYTVTGTDINGCQNTAVKTISVNPLPIVNANVTNSVVCFGNTTTLFGSGANTYSWTGGVVDNSAFSPSSTSSYTVTGTATNGCQNTAVKTITVINIPSVGANASNSIICFGNPTTLFGSGATSYTWSSGITNNISFTPNSTATYTVFGSNACGTTSNVITVSVNPLPLVVANTTNSVICLGNATSLFGSGAFTYTWTNGVVNAVSFSPTITATYSVTGTDINGCKNSASKLITVNPLPNVTANASNTVFCFGNSTILNGGGAITYTWTSGVVNNSPFTPSATGSYTVIGTDANGCQNTAVKTITVNPLPVVTANSSATAVCLGNSVICSGAGANTYTWSGGITNGLAFFPSVTSTYTVNGTNTLTGCTSTNSAIKTISVNSLPIVGTVTNAIIICVGSSVTLNGTGANTYVWTGGITDGLAFMPNSSNSYTVIGTNTLTGCSSTNAAVVNITVNALPTLSISASNSVICFGSSVSLNATNANTYTWTSGVINGILFSPSVTATYTVTGSNTLTGCSNTASQLITVNALPILVVNASNTMICVGNSITFNCTGATTYTWTNGIVNGTPFSPTISTTYTVIGTNTLSGCVNSKTQAVVVNPLPLVTISNNSVSICIGNTVSLNASGADTYTWTGGVINGAIFIPTVSASYFVSGTSTLTGCSSTNIASQVITVNSLPIVSGTISNSLICYGDQITLNGFGADTYSWTGGVINAQAFSPTITSTYSLTGTNSLTGCTSTNSAVQNVTVNSLPIISISSNNSTICVGESAVLSALGALSYTWSTNENTPTISVSPLLSTTYTVTGININGCVNSNVYMQYVTDCTGIPAEKSENRLAVTLFPNPNNGQFKISSFRTEIKLTILNELGQRIRVCFLNEDNNYEVSICELPNGIYFAVGQKDTRVFSQKIIVAK